MRWSIMERAVMRLRTVEPSWEIAALPSLTMLSRGYAKLTTGIVGLPVDENARENLKAKLNEVLDAIQVIPSEAEYRRVVEATCQDKLSLVNSDATDEQIEDDLGRQLEQEIKMCREELKLIPKMAEWKPWEVPEGHKIEFYRQRIIDEDESQDAEKKK